MEIPDPAPSPRTSSGSGKITDPGGADAAIRLATMRAEVGLELPDCCGFLAAQEAAAHGIVTFDDARTRAAEWSGFETV